MLEPVVISAALLVVVMAVVLAAEWTLAPRPAHAGAGVGALNVWQLRAQLDVEHDERIEWPRVDPDAGPSLDTLRRVLDGLRRL